jgi:hypothetical protein
MFKNSENFEKMSKSRRLLTTCILPCSSMVYCKISADMKQRALQLLEEGWELSEIASVLGHQENLYFLLWLWHPFFFLFLPLGNSKGNKKEAKGVL